MLSPTVLDEHVVYPVNSYGSGMAPLFTNLAMWAGVFMLVALMKLEADDEGVEDLTATQAYLGRWLLLAVMAAAQGADRDRRRSGDRRADGQPGRVRGHGGDRLGDVQRGSRTCWPSRCCMWARP